MIFITKRLQVNGIKHKYIGIYCCCHRMNNAIWWRISVTEYTGPMFKQHDLWFTLYCEFYWLLWFWLCIACCVILITVLYLKCAMTAMDNELLCHSSVYLSGPATEACSYSDTDCIKAFIHHGKLHAQIKDSQNPTSGSLSPPRQFLLPLLPSGHARPDLLFSLHVVG